MRLDSRKGDKQWSVYDCELCRVLKFVVWVDTEIPAYGQFRLDSEGRHVLIDYDVVIDEHRVRKITISEAARTVLINPKEDEEQSAEEAREIVGRPLTVEG